MSKRNYQTNLAKVFAGTLLRASLTVLLLAPLAALSATKFSFDDPAGPQFSDAEKRAQFEKGNGTVELVRTAFDSGAESVTIPPDDYRLGKETWGKGGPIYPLEFRDMKRDAAHPFRIIAEGVTFWFNLPPDQAPSAHFALRFIDCSHISLKGATLDRDPRGCMEGRITQLDDAGNRIEIEASKGTLSPSNFSGELEQRLVPFNADGTFCTALYALQLKAPGQLMYRNVEPGTQPGRYWVNLHEKSELLNTNRDPAWLRAYGDAGTLQVGDGLSLVYSTTLAIGLMDSTALKLIGVKSCITKGCSRELGGGGEHLWKDCYFGPRPGTCHWQGGEGFLYGCMERGSTYDGITMLHTTDDIMNMNGFWGYPEKTERQTITLQREHQMPAQPGDELSFYDAQTGQPAGKATVTAVNGQILTLDRDSALFANAIAENPRFQCDGWTVKNCIFKDCYQRLLVQGGNGGTLRDNTFTRVGSHISLESNFFTKNEGGICRNILIDNNTFDQVAIHPDGVTLVAGFQSLNHQASTALLSNITVRGNRFIGSGKHAIEFKLVNGGDIFRQHLHQLWQAAVACRQGFAGGRPAAHSTERLHQRYDPTQPTMKPALILIAALLLMPLAALNAADAPMPAGKPNILWLVAEDMSPHFGCYGEKTIQTPNLDQLAADGELFERGFVTGPICSPGRSGLLTGMYQTSIGLPLRPFLQPNAYKEHKPCLVALREVEEAGQLNDAQRLIFAKTRSPEELNNLENDPWEIQNLAADPVHAAVLKVMHDRLGLWMEQTNDHGRTPETEAAYDANMAAYLKKAKDPEIGRNFALMKQRAKEGK